MRAELADSITVAAPPADVYQAVSDSAPAGALEPGVLRHAGLVAARRRGRRFVGFNRRGPWVWFTTCRVVTAEPGREFAFDVTTFGMPVSRWSYQVAAVNGGTEVTERWLDQRGRGAHVLGRMFTGKVANARPEANREGISTTLARLKRELESVRR